jgi:hypothetical protein
METPFFILCKTDVFSFCFTKVQHLIKYFQSPPDFKGYLTVFCIQTHRKQERIAELAIIKSFYHSGSNCFVCPLLNKNQTSRDIIL